MALLPMEQLSYRIHPDDWDDYVEGQDDLTPGWRDYEHHDAPEPSRRNCPECRGTCVVRGTEDPCPGCFGEGVV